MRATQIQFRWALFAAVLLSVIVAGQVSAQSSCLTVTLHQPVVFPDGSEHAAGRLTLCDWKAFTPVAQIHRSYMDGRPIQLLMGRRSTSERSVTEPDQVFFRPDSYGRLELIGYARTYRGRSMTVSFQRQNPPRKVDHRLARATGEDDDLLIVMMARPH